MCKTEKTSTFGLTFLLGKPSVPGFWLRSGALYWHFWWRGLFGYSGSWSWPPWGCRCTREWGCLAFVCFVWFIRLGRSFDEVKESTFTLLLLSILRFWTPQGTSESMTGNRWGFNVYKIIHYYSWFKIQTSVVCYEINRKTSQPLLGIYFGDFFREELIYTLVHPSHEAILLPILRWGVVDLLQKRKRKQFDKILGLCTMQIPLFVDFSLEVRLYSQGLCSIGFSCSF